MSAVKTKEFAVDEARYGLCDPEKAVKCKKTCCYINGGECHHTSNPAWFKTRKGDTK